MTHSLGKYTRSDSNTGLTKRKEKKKEKKTEEKKEAAFQLHRQNSSFPPPAQPIKAAML